MKFCDLSDGEEFFLSGLHMVKVNEHPWYNAVAWSDSGHGVCIAAETVVSTRSEVQEQTKRIGLQMLAMCVMANCHRKG